MSNEIIKELEKLSEKFDIIKYDINIIKNDTDSVSIGLKKIGQLLDSVHSNKPRETYHTIDENNVVTVFDSKTDAPLYMMPLVDFEAIKNHK